MKIAFLCGSFQLERSGVADYCAQLASEITRYGHTCSLLTLYDAGVQSPTKETLPWGTVYRLPKDMPLAEKRSLAEEFLQENEVEWLSLQLVSYNFAYQGLLYRITPLIEALSAGRKVHCFLHEVWISLYKRLNPKEYIIGNLQRHSLLRLLKRINPQVIHAACACYIEVYARHGIHAHPLPLFSSIPPHLPPDRQGAEEKIRATGLLPENESLADTLLVSIFGSLRSTEWSVAPLAKKLTALAAKEGKRCIVLSFGGNESNTAEAKARAEAWTTAFKHCCPEDDTKLLRAAVLGPCSSSLAAGLLRLSSLGLSTTPIAFMDRSTATATMLDFKLPVLAVGGSVHFPGFAQSCEIEGVTPLSEFDPEAGLQALKKRAMPICPGQVAAQFMDALVKQSKPKLPKQGG